MQRKTFFTLLLTFGLVQTGFSQMYKLTHFMLTVNSRPQAYDGPTIIVGDTFLMNITEIKRGDTTDHIMTKERILKKKKTHYVKTEIPGGANNYYIEPSEIKAEKKAGIFEITVEAAMNNGSTKTLFFKGKKIENTN